MNDRMPCSNGVVPMRLLRWAAVTSLGESAAETALLLRAGVVNVAPSRFIGDDGERVMVCAAPALAPSLAGVDRLVALAVHALQALCESIDATRESTDDAVVPRMTPLLLVALPERFRGEGREVELNESGRRFLVALRSQLPAMIAAAEILVFPVGRAGGAFALGRAGAVHERGRLVIWGGVDSLHDWDVLQGLARSQRLLTRDNVDGVRPGEAAAFVWIGTETSAEAVDVLAIGTGDEPIPVTSELPSSADGLSLALDAALAPLIGAGLRSNYWLLDSTHESYSTQALQNVITRFGHVLGTRALMETPLKELGDVGAAAMPLLAVLGAEAFRLGHAADRVAVVTGASDGGARGAMLLAPTDGGRALPETVA